MMDKGRFLNIGGRARTIPAFDAGKEPHTPSGSDLAQTFKDNAAQEESKRQNMDKATETKLLDASPGFRVTDAMEDAAIFSAAYHRLTDVLTVCVLTLANGFTVTGESACVSPENYNQDLGEHYAYVDAKRKVGAFEAYAYRDREYRGKDKPEPTTGDASSTSVGTSPYNEGEYSRVRALELAMAGTEGWTTDTIVARARTFYEYIKNGELK